MRKKLLLADDSLTIQKVIGIIFSTEDYDLLVADNGDEAFEKALAEYPDLVIADVLMPGRDGFALCQAIKAEPRLQHTSVLLLPGTFESFDERRAEEVGADGWISKPFESQALLDKVALLLEAEPVRLASSEAVEPEPVPVSDAALADEPAMTEEAMPEEPLAESADDTAVAFDAAEPDVDETVLGLDEIEELEPEAETSIAEEDSDDIWDAVSFEEEELQQVEDLAPPETDFAEEFADAPAGAAVDSSVELEDDASGDADFSFGGEDEGEELIEVADETAEIEPLGAAGDDADFSFGGEEEEPLELTEEVEETTSADQPSGEDSDFTFGGGEEEALDLVAEESDVPLELQPEEVLEEEAVDSEVPVVEPVDESAVAEDEEILDLAEGDILEEEMVADDSDMAAVSMPESEPEAVSAAESGEEGFYFDAADAEAVEEEAVSEVAAEAEAVVTAESAAADQVDQVEQQLRSLSDEELKEVVARVAGPTIEKLAGELLEQIVWEVVPDLAESMIREEIRKIRQGAE